LEGRGVEKVRWEWFEKKKREMMEQKTSKRKK